MLNWIIMHDDWLLFYRFFYLIISHFFQLRLWWSRWNSSASTIRSYRVSMPSFCLLNHMKESSINLFVKGRSVVLLVWIIEALSWSDNSVAFLQIYRATTISLENKFKFRWGIFATLIVLMINFLLKVHLTTIHSWLRSWFLLL